MSVVKFVKQEHGVCFYERVCVQLLEHICCTGGEELNEHLLACSIKTFEVAARYVNSQTTEGHKSAPMSYWSSGTLGCFGRGGCRVVK